MNRKIRFALMLTILPLASLGAGGTPAAMEDAGPMTAHLANQRMLVVHMTGDPAKVAQLAYRELFKTFYRHADKAEKQGLKTVRARWAAGLDEKAKASWQGRYALPVSDAFPALASGNIAVETWEYGLVAEILHLGPYSAMGPAIAMLKAYIAANGLVILGDHEEVYLRGPWLFIKGDPAKYRTLIRYRVASAGNMERPLADVKVGKESL